MARNLRSRQAMRAMARPGTAVVRTFALALLWGCGVESVNGTAHDAAEPSDATQVLDASSQGDAGDAASSGQDAAALRDAASPATDAEAGAKDAASQSANDAGTLADGAVQSGSCTKHADCMLVAKSCCACEKTLDNVRALPLGADASVACPGLCGACAPIPYDPLNAWVAPACVQGQCAVHDLRKAPETSCTRADECIAVAESVTCCQSCSSDPKLWRARRKDSAVTTAGSACVGDVFCPACEPIPPEVFCAADGHCAVR
jgi:hypothetical protein